MYFKQTTAILASFCFTTLHCEPGLFGDQRQTQLELIHAGDHMRHLWSPMLTRKQQTGDENAKNDMDLPNKCNKDEVIDYCRSRCFRRVMRSKTFEELLNNGKCLNICTDFIFDDDCPRNVMGRVSATLNKMKHINRLKQFSGKQEQQKKKKKKRRSKKDRRKKEKLRRLDVKTTKNTTKKTIQRDRFLQHIVRAQRSRAKTSQKRPIQNKNNGSKKKERKEKVKKKKDKRTGRTMIRESEVDVSN